MADVFVSYATSDRDRVAPIVSAIEAEGWSVWWDRAISGGAAFDREIERAIDEAHCIVVVWSEQSVDSDWVRTEANEGLERKILVPVAIDAVRPPLAFRRTQTLDFRDPADQAAVPALVDAIQRLAPRTGNIGDQQNEMVGRSDELEQIEQVLGEARHGRGNLLLISGEAGAGKTLLTREAAARARSTGMLALAGHCSEMGGAPPYEPFLEQIEQAIRNISARTLRDALGENAPEIAKVMPELRRIYTDIPDPIELPPDQDRRYLLHGFGEFVERSAAAQPLVLIYEDLHWADPSTCIMLRHLAERARSCSVVLIGTYRHDDLTPSAPFARVLQELVKQRLVQEVHLRRLTRESVAQLLEARAQRTPSDRMVDFVFEVTEGNPFFVEEVYRNLAESGKFIADDDARGTQISDLDVSDVDVPPGVRLVLEQRLDRVSNPCRQTLTRAAVVGRRFSFELLREIAEGSEDALLNELEEAEAAALVEDISTGREARFQFAHELVRQTLLSSLSFPRRQRLHLRIGAAMEALPGKARASELAHHYYFAGAAADTGKTIDHLLRAAHEALDALAFEEALNQLDRALEVAETADPDTSARIEIMRATALRGAARVEESLATLATAMRYEVSEPMYRQLRFERATLLVDLYRGGEAIPDIDALLDLAEEQNDTAMELQAQLLLTEAQYRISLDHPEAAQPAKAASDRAIQLAREVNDRRALATALLSSTHFVDYWQDYREQALRNLAEARRIGLELADEEIQLDAETISLRVDQFTPVDWTIAAEEVCERLETRRDPIRLKEHLFWMIIGTHNAGQLQRCLEVCDSAIEIADRLGVPPVQYPTLKGLALLDLGRFAEAAASMALEPNDSKYRFGRALQSLGFLQLHANLADVDWVMDRAPALLDEVHALHRVWMVERLFKHVATAAALSGRIGEARPILERASQMMQSEPDPISEAELKNAGGDPDQAAEIALAAAEYSRNHGHVIRRVEALDVALRALDRLERWSELKVHADTAIAVAEASEFARLLWRLHALRAAANEALGCADAASEDRNHATRIFREICGSIGDPHLRRTYARQAEALGLPIDDG